MAVEVRRTIFRHGLAFYGTLAFVASFLGARLFATLNPTVTVVRAGIHFHHFWYGLAMVVSTGWLRDYSQQREDGTQSSDNLRSRSWADRRRSWPASDLRRLYK